MQFRFRIFSLSLIAILAVHVVERSKAEVLPDPLSAPPTITPVILVGDGLSQRTKDTVGPWRVDDPTKLTGRYRLIGISDGHGWLDLKVRKVVSEGSEEPGWRVEARVITEWTKEERSTLWFQGAWLERDTPIPYFEVSRRHLVGFFVEFTYRSDEQIRPTENAIIIGPDIFVRDDKYEPTLYQ